MDCNPQAPLSMGFSRQDYWSGLPCPPPGDLPNPGIELVSLALSLVPPGHVCTNTQTHSLRQTPCSSCPKESSLFYILSVIVFSFFLPCLDLCFLLRYLLSKALCETGSAKLKFTTSVVHPSHWAIFTNPPGSPENNVFPI